MCAAGCDKEVKLWDLASQQTTTIGKHDAPIRHLNVCSINNAQMVVTGSWDKTLRYWDLRSPNPVHTQPLAERVYALDVRGPLLVVGTANRRLNVRALYVHVCTPTTTLSISYTVVGGIGVLSL